MEGQVKIGREFFSKIKNDYADWRWALVREFLQNSFDAPGCSEVEVDIRGGEGAMTVLTVRNNGAPMTRDILVNKLLTLGGSGKNFEGENTGGFGVAKSLLYYCHLGYRIRTGEMLVEGEGAQYRIKPDDFDGTESSIRVQGDEVQALCSMVKRFASFAQWKGQLTLNGLSLSCSLHKGHRRKDLGWGVVYTNNSFSNQCIIRINGQPMFTMFTRFKGCVLVELTGKAVETLTSNRDALKHKLQSELSDLLTALAVDKKSALREQKAEYKRYKGEMQKNEAKKPKEADGGLAAAFAPTDLLKQLGLPSPAVGQDGGTPIGEKGTETPGVRVEPVPESARGGGGSIKVVAVSREEETTISVGPQFILKNCSGMKTPVRFVPGEKFAKGSKELVLSWTALLLKLYQLHNVSGEFSVGFVIDEESEAEHEMSSTYGRVYYINPTKMIESEGKRRLETRYDSVWGDRFRIISTAAHEFVHGLGFKEHDEDYSSKLTEVMEVVLQHMEELSALCRPVRAAIEVESHEQTSIPNDLGIPVVRMPNGQYQVFGHSVSAILRCLGAIGYPRSRVRHFLQALNVDDRSYNMGHFEGKFGPAPELTEEQVELLKSIYGERR